MGEGGLKSRVIDAKNSLGRGRLRKEETKRENHHEHLLKGSERAKETIPEKQRREKRGPEELKQSRVEGKAGRAGEGKKTFPQRSLCRKDLH